MLVPSIGWERAGRRAIGLRADPCARPPVDNFGSGCPSPIGQDSPRLSVVLGGMQGDIGSTLGRSVGHISKIRPTSWQASCLVFSQGSRCEIGIEVASASAHTGFLSKRVGGISCPPAPADTATAQGPILVSLLLGPAGRGLALGSKGRRGIEQGSVAGAIPRSRRRGIADL